MKAHCINLVRRPDRKVHMAKLFEHLGMPVTWFPAIDGTLPAVAEQIASLTPGRSGRTLGTGAYACFQSHRAIWRDLVESGDGHALIMEDDLMIADGFADYLQDGWVPADADLVKLEARNVRVQLDRKTLGVSGGRHLSRLYSSHFGTGAYVISAKAAQRLHALTETVNDAIDEVIFDESSPQFDGLIIYQMVPGPVIQGDLLASRPDMSWSRTSIEQRFGAGQSHEVAEKSLVGRLLRRGRAEVRALLGGTRYVQVPYG